MDKSYQYYSTTAEVDRLSKLGTHLFSRICEERARTHMWRTVARIEAVGIVVMAGLAGFAVWELL